MIAHVVLFTPRGDLSAAERDEFLGALAGAAARIPAIRGFRVGRRVRHGLPGYEQAMRDDYEFAAIAEFDDLEGLKSYLTHPAHDALGRHFAASSARALAYDYAMVEAGESSTLAG